jgi:HSP20 family protein
MRIRHTGRGRYNDMGSSGSSNTTFDGPNASSLKKTWSLNTELDGMLRNSMIDDIVETSISSALANALDSITWGYPPSSNFDQGDSKNNVFNKKDVENDYSALKDVINQYRELSKQHKDLKDTKGFYPRVNVIRKDKELVIEAAIPGYTKEDISVEIKDGFLILRGSASSDEDRAAGYTYICREIKRSKFQRSFMLPDNLELSAVEAAFLNGMLEVRIPYKNVDANSKSVSNIQIR